MAYADNLRSVTATMNACASSIEGIFSSGYGLTWSTWTPSYSANGAMTFTSVTTDYTKYIQVGKLVIFCLTCHGTVGGTPDTGLIITLPVTPSSNALAYAVNLSANASDAGGATKQAFAYLLAPNKAYAFKYDNSNWTAGTATVRISGFYEAA